MIIGSLTTEVIDRAQRVSFTLSCLQESVRRARAEAKVQAKFRQQYEANLAARWRG